MGLKVNDNGIIAYCSSCDRYRRTIDLQNQRIAEMERELQHRCDHCGANIIDNCHRCGAPQCCPQCCRIDEGTAK